MKRKSTRNKGQNTNMSHSSQQNRPKPFTLANLVRLMIVHKSMRTNQTCLQFSFNTLDSTKFYTHFLINPSSYFVFHGYNIVIMFLLPWWRSQWMSEMFSLINYSKITLCIDATSWKVDTGLQLSIRQNHSMSTWGIAIKCLCLQFPYMGVFGLFNLMLYCGPRLTH